MTPEHTVTPQTVVWRQVHWPLPLDTARALAVVRSLAADQRSPRLILEARATNEGVGYLLGGSLTAVLNAQHRLRSAVPDTRITEITSQRVPLISARRLKLSTRHRPLRADHPEAVARSVLGVLSQVGENETLVLQVILGPRRIPLAVPNNSPSSIVMPWY
jgi:hypothetical protein